LKWRRPARYNAFVDRKALLDPRLSRREFLGTLACLAVWPHACGGVPSFFTASERATLEALCDRILPPDADPGARALGAPAYIERLLAAFDRDPPFLFAGGPFSGRNPWPDLGDGTVSSIHPSNRFADPVPPSWSQDLYWRAQILGGEAAQLPHWLAAQRGGALRGLREIYREGLAIVDERALAATGSLFSELPAAQQDALLPALDAPGVFPADPVRGRHFFDLLVQHTLEGCFSAPEYGGNAGGAGWALLGIEGDSQPLGYSLFSESTQNYVERPGHPMSTPNPDELGPGGALAPRPLSAEGLAVQQAISQFTATLEQLIPGACS
jgi:hypothetical protein